MWDQSKGRVKERLRSPRSRERGKQVKRKNERCAAKLQTGEAGGGLDSLTGSEIRLTVHDSGSSRENTKARGDVFVSD